MRKTNSFYSQPADQPAPSPIGSAAGTGPDADFLLQCLPWGVVVLDAHGTVLRLNQQAADWWGAPQQDLVGKRLEQPTAGTLPADLLQALQQVTSSPAQPPGEFFLPQPQQWITMSSTRQGDDWVVYWQDVTAQKQRQDENDNQQAASDSLLGRTEAVARIGSYELELATGRFHFSDGLCRLFGEESGAFVPEMAFINSRSHPDDVAGVQQVLAQAIADCQPYYYQRRIYRSDGQLRTLEVHGRVECDALGQPVKLLGLLQDVTEREQAAQELLRVKDELARRATDNYVALYNSMDEGFCIIEVLFDAAGHPFDYRFLDVNPAFEKQTGLRGALNKTVRELVPAHEQHWFDTYGRVARTGEPTRFEAQGVAMGRWFDVNAFSIGPPQHRHVAILFADITERKQTQEALRQSEARYRSLFANMEQGFSLVEKIATAAYEPSDYRYLVVNPAFGRHSGLVVAAGQTIREVIPGIEPHIMAIYDEVVASGEPRRFETHVAALDQWFEVEVVPEAQPGRLAVLFSNVSVRHRAEEILRESEARQTYLLALSDALRPVADAAAVQAIVTHTALHYFAADRCHYAEVAGDTLTIRQDAARPGLPSVAGVYPLSGMPLFRAALQGGQPVVTADVEDSPLMNDISRQICRETHTRASIHVPVMRTGKLAGILCLTQVIPRAWTALDVALLQETAERTWTALEQARAEEALRQSEEQFRLLVTATSDTVYRMSADWTHMQQLIGKGFLVDILDPTPDWMAAYIPDEDLPLVQATIAEGIRHQRVLELEHRVRRADGTIGWTYSRAIPVLDARGELMSWLGTASDVSVRKQVETDLRESEQRQRVLIENLPGAAVFVVDCKLRYQLAEGEALRQAGYEPADFRGRNVRDVTPPALWPTFRDFYRQALAGRAFEHEHAQGGRTFISRGVPLLGPAGQIEAVLAVSYDITDRKAAEEALRVSEAKYRILFDSIDEGFVVSELLYDEQGRAVDALMLETNPSYDRITQTTGAAGRRAREIFPEAESAWFEMYAQVVETGEGVRFENYFAPLDSWIEMFVVRVGGAGSRRFASVFNDITARKRHENHAAFLDELAQALTVLDGPDEIVRATGERLGVYLGVGFLNVVDVELKEGDEPAEARFTVASAWEREGLPSPRGTYRAGDYLSPEFLRAARAGEAIVIRDTDTDPRVDAEAYRAIGLRAFVAVPVLNAQGAWPGLISAFTPSPRDWRPDEVKLLVEVGHRVFPRVERARAEEALRVSEAKYRTLFETMDQGFGIGEVLPAGPGRPADFRWLEVNPQVERLTGMPQAALLSGETMRVVMPQLEDIWYERYEQVALTGEPVRFEQHAQVLGRWFDVYAYALDGPASHRIALLFTNITARKQAEEALRHAEEHHRERLEQQVVERTEELLKSRNLLQTVFDASPTAIVVMRLLQDAAGQAEDFEFLIYNEFNKKVVGRDDLVGQRFSAMFPQTVPTGTLARLLQVATTGEPADFEQWYEGEGMRHWFRHIVVWQDGLLVLTSEVITARKLMEQARAQSLALLQQSEAVAVMGSWEYDLESREFTWSDGLYHLFELPMGSAVELQFFLDTVLDDDRPAAAKLVRTLTIGAAGFDTTLRMHVGQAVKTVRFKAVPLPDAPGTPERVLGVCLDVSDVQRLEAENLALKLDRHKELLLAILQAQENERRRLGEVLHNGLGQILYATKLHLDQLDTPALRALPVLAGLHQQTGRLLADAMRQTRTLAHELVPTSLLDFGLAAAVCDVCRDLSTPQLRIACHVWGEEKVLPQPVQVTLFRLVQELAHNIVRHAGATEATLELETLPGGVSLRAEDNGHGFDPLTVAEGLGLRTVRQAVALLGGTVAVDSSPEFGTHVRLRIPLPLFS